MKCKAELWTDSTDAAAVAASLSVDNVCEEKLALTTKVEKNQIHSTIETEKLPTMLATIDDLLVCQMTAEKVITN